MTEQEFEKYWQANKQRLLSQDDDYRQARDSYKMTSGADWLLFAIPVGIGIVFMDYCPIEHELLKWLACAAVTIVSFVLCVLVKSLTGGNQSIDDIEKKKRQQLHDKMVD